MQNGRSILTISCLTEMEQPVVRCNRSVPANTIQAINSLQTHSREMDISLSDGGSKWMAAILFMEMVQQYQIFPLQMEQQ